MIENLQTKHMRKAASIGTLYLQFLVTNYAFLFSTHQTHEKEKTFIDAYVNHIGGIRRGGSWNEKERQYLRCIAQTGTDTGRKTTEDAVMARTISQSVELQQPN